MNRLLDQIDRGRVARLLKDQQGAASVEYVLLLAAVGLPLYGLLYLLLALLTDHYRMLTFLETLPFP